MRQLPAHCVSFGLTSANMACERGGSMFSKPFFLSNKDSRSLSRHLKDVQKHLNNGDLHTAQRHLGAILNQIFHLEYPTPEEKLQQLKKKQIAKAWLQND